MSASSLELDLCLEMLSDPDFLKFVQGSSPLGIRSYREKLNDLSWDGLVALFALSQTIPAPGSGPVPPARAVDACIDGIITAACDPVTNKVLTAAHLALMTLSVMDVEPSSRSLTVIATWLVEKLLESCTDRSAISGSLEPLCAKYNQLKTWSYSPTAVGATLMDTVLSAFRSTPMGAAIDRCCS